VGADAPRWSMALPVAAAKNLGIPGFLLSQAGSTDRPGRAQRRLQSRLSAHAPSSAAAAVSAQTVRRGWPCNQLAGQSTSGDPRSARVRTAAFASPLTTSQVSRAARISSRPRVMAHSGTLRPSSKASSLVARVLDCEAHHTRGAVASTGWLVEGPVAVHTKPQELQPKTTRGGAMRRRYRRASSVGTGASPWGSTHESGCSPRGL